MLTNTLAMLLAMGSGGPVAIDRMSVYSQCPEVKRWDMMRDSPSENASMNSEKPSLPLLRDRLIEMARKDQVARDALIKAVSEEDLAVAISHISRIDSENMHEVSVLIEEHGTPTKGMIGKDGMDAFLTIVQHAPSGSEFQRNMLAELSSAESGVSRSDLAMLEDRIRVGQSLPQIYGTQFRRVDGRFVPYEIHEPDQVDSRRAAVGLMPISDYTCLLEATYPPE